MNGSSRIAAALSIALALVAPGYGAMGDEPATGPAAPELEVAIAAVKKKDWPTALEKLQAAHRKDAKNADVHNLLGYSYRNSGDLDRAFIHYRSALEIDAGHKSAHEYIGEAYLLARQPAKAREHLARLKAICGETCEEYQDLAKAIAGYKP